MSRHAREKNPEIRPSCEMPLFEQSFYKFESGRTHSSGAGENGDCRSLRDAQSSSSSPRDVARARRSDPQTSVAAAKSVRVINLGKTKDLIMDILRDCGPLCDEEIKAEFRLREKGKQIAADSGIRTRRNWLKENGFIENSGCFKKLASGRLSIIWKLAERPMGEQK